jgi:hypothetical protein
MVVVFVLNSFAIVISLAGSVILNIMVIRTMDTPGSAFFSQLIAMVFIGLLAVFASLLYVLILQCYVIGNCKKRQVFDLRMGVRVETSDPPPAVWFISRHHLGYDFERAPPQYERERPEQSSNCNNNEESPPSYETAIKKINSLNQPPRTTASRRLVAF